MAARRAPHSKTRLGCHQCKRRRIKCDVKQPSCANCEKKGLECSFLLLAPASRLSAYRSAPQKTTPLSATAALSIIKSDTAVSPTRLESPNRDSPNWGISTTPSTQISECDLLWSKTGSNISLSPHESTSQIAFAFSLSSVAPLLRFADAWQDIRTNLPSSMQEILNHYEYTTSLTRASNDPAKAVWQTYVPEMASDHDFLVNCVLSVAALHLGRLRESRDEKSKMNAVAASRMNKALTRYRPELSRVTQQNAPALFASATLTAVYLFRTTAIDIEELRSSIPPGIIDPPQAVIDKMLSCTLRPIWGLRGPLTVLMSGWNWVVGGKLQPVTARKWWPRNRVPATTRAVSEDERLRQLEDLWMDTDRRWGLEHEHLSHALAYLRDAFALVSQLTLPETYPPMTSVPYSIDDKTVGTLTDRGAIFVWMARISREFIQLVEAKDRDALVILAYYAVLPGRVRNVWWLEGLGGDMVTAVALALGRERWSLIAWPASVVGVDLDNLFGARQDRLEGLPEEMSMSVI